MSMEAHLIRLVAVVSVFSSVGAVYRTPNFVVQAPTEDIARQVGEAAEKYRAELAVEWLGKELPGNWSKPCTVKVRVGQIGAGGATTFSFDQGEVFGWNMRVQGSLERILDSVLPHEITHTILACHFRRPLPRWADEGAATLVEHESEKRRQQLMLKQVFNTSHRIPLRKLFSLTEYPSQMQSVLTLYAEGYSLADYLIQRGDKSRFLKFLEEAHRKNWDYAVRKHYGFETVESLEKRWHKWVLAGSPELNLSEGGELAAVSTGINRQPSAPAVTIRGQTPPGRDLVRSNERDISSLKRGHNLVAPDPRTGKTTKFRTSNDPGKIGNREFQQPVMARLKERQQSKITAGRLRALNDGWIPVKSRHFPQVSSLKMNSGNNVPALFHAEHKNRLQESRRNQNRVADGLVKNSSNRFLPLTGLRVGDGTRHRLLDNRPATHTSRQDRRNALPQRSQRWSEFPHSRTSDSSALLGNASVSSFSPR